MSADELNIQQYKKMTETPIPKLILGLAAPTILSMLITSIYNLADTFFVGQISTSASGAVGIVSSLMAIIQGLALHWATAPAPSSAAALAAGTPMPPPALLPPAFLLLWPLAWGWPLWALPLCPAS